MDSANREVGGREARGEPLTPGSCSPIRLRAFLLGLALIVPSNHWVIYGEAISRAYFSTTISLFANVILILAVLVLANSQLKRVSPRHALNQAELLVIYIMVSVGAAFAGHDMVQVLIQMLGHPYRFAGHYTGRMGTIAALIPDWMLVQDREALSGFYAGGSSLWTGPHLAAWAVPVACWGGFAMVCLFVLMCINVLVRNQWVERERLTFPIAQIPIAMTDPSYELWRNRSMWIGFSIVAGIGLVNAVATFFPSVPTISLSFGDLGQMVNEKPWTAIGWTPLEMSPFAVGLGFLLPTDLLFSCWFFYLVGKAQLVVSSMMAWDANPQFPYLKQQGLGGYMGAVALLFWAGRGYLAQLWLAILGRKSQLDNSGEAMSYRAAALGAFVGLVLLVNFFTYAGMSPLIAIAAFGIYFAISMAIARMRAELGPPVHDLYAMGPDAIIPQFAGTSSLSPRDLTMITQFFWFNRSFRGHPIAHGIEGLKMATVTRSSQRKFLVAIMLAGAFGWITAFGSHLALDYRIGQATVPYGTSFGDEPYNRLDHWLGFPAGPDLPANMATIGGLLFALFLGSMRLYFLGWPLHPIGFALSSSWSMNLVWMPLMVAWVLKVIVIKSGGMKLYKASLPFFLGLLIGDMVVGALVGLLQFFIASRMT